MVSPEESSVVWHAPGQAGLREPRSAPGPSSRVWPRASGSLGSALSSVKQGWSWDPLVDWHEDEVCCESAIRAASAREVVRMVWVSPVPTPGLQLLGVGAGV